MGWGNDSPVGVLWLLSPLLQRRHAPIEIAEREAYQRFHLDEFIRDTCLEPVHSLLESINPFHCCALGLRQEAYLRTETLGDDIEMSLDLVGCPAAHSNYLLS